MGGWSKGGAPAAGGHWGSRGGSLSAGQFLPFFFSIKITYFMHISAKIIILKQ